MNRKTYIELMGMDIDMLFETIRAQQIANQYKMNTQTIREILALFYDTQESGRVLVDYAGNRFLIA